MRVMVQKQVSSGIIDIDKTAFAIMDGKGKVHIHTVIPFTGSERLCWDCGKPRELWVAEDAWVDACC